MLVTKEVHFDAAHQLPDYDGPCAFLHGHRWNLHVTVEGNIYSKTGMVLDFKHINKALEPILQILDHTNLNSLLKNPTCENLLVYIAERLDQSELGDCWYSIKLYESPDSYGTMYKNDFRINYKKV